MQNENEKEKDFRGNMFFYQIVFFSSVFVDYPILKKSFFSCQCSEFRIGKKMFAKFREIQ